jgi:hypothetical protein
MKKEVKKNDLTGAEMTQLIVSYIFSIVGIIVFIIATIVFISKGYVSEEIFKSEESSHLGDFISGVAGSLWALVGVLLLFLTLNLQRKELKAQREELEMTREELKGQKEALDEANKFASRQQFDNQFFQMLSLHNQIKSSLRTKAFDIGFSETEFKDIGFFHFVSQEISDQNEHISGWDELNKKVYDIQNLVSSFETIYFRRKAELGHYFRNLFHLIRIVDESSCLTSEDKVQYIKLIRSQLSQYELVLISYNGLTSRGEKIKSYIEKYRLLKNIDFELQDTNEIRPKIINPQVWVKYYPHLLPMLDEQRQFIQKQNDL